MSLITQFEFLDRVNDSSNYIECDLELHDYLTDDADWAAEYWDIEQNYLEQYCGRLEKLYSQSTFGISFSALWVGEKPTKTINLGIDEFLEIVKSNKIGTKTKYIVYKDA